MHCRYSQKIWYHRCYCARQRGLSSMYLVSSEPKLNMGFFNCHGWLVVLTKDL